jgi:hypothetical protein
MGERWFRELIIPHFEMWGCLTGGKKRESTR